MASAAHNGNIERVKTALAKNHREGLTTVEVALALGIDRDNAAALLKWLHTPSPKHPVKRVYIAYWREDGEMGQKKYPRAVYKLGDLPDEPKPPPKSAKKKSREYRARQRARNTTSSVFNLGNTGYRSTSEKAVRREYDVFSGRRGQLSLFPDAIELNEVRKAQSEDALDRIVKDNEDEARKAAAMYREVFP